jgi:hypothetical protein
LAWDNRSTHVSKAMRALVAARDWLTAFQLAPYASELSPVESAWSHLKRSLASLVKRDIAQLKALAKTRLRRMQCRHSLIEGFLAGTRLDLTPSVTLAIEDRQALGTRLRPAGLSRFTHRARGGGAGWAVGRTDAGACPPVSSGSTAPLPPIERMTSRLLFAVYQVGGWTGAIVKASLKILDDLQADRELNPQGKRYGQDRDRHDHRNDDRVSDHEGADDRAGDRSYCRPDRLDLVVVHAGCPFARR